MFSYCFFLPEILNFSSVQQLDEWMNSGIDLRNTIAIVFKTNNQQKNLAYEIRTYPIRSPSLESRFGFTHNSSMCMAFQMFVFIHTISKVIVYD